MVQVFRTENPQGKISEMLGMSLGQGIGNGLNTYFANRSLESVLQDKALEGAPQSKKLEALRSALSPYGEKGAELFNQRLQIDQMETQEAKAKEEKKEALEKEQRLFKHQKELQELKNTGKTMAAGERPVNEQQLDAINKAHATPGYEDMTEGQKYNTLVQNGVSTTNAIKEATLASQQKTRESQDVERAYKSQEDFINDTTNAYKSFETEFKPRLLQMSNIRDEELISPTASVFLDSLGIPLGALSDPSSELYQKLSQDLLKGLPETYGSRILKVEVDNFLKTIPTLMNSADGRRMITSNMLKLGEMKEVYYNAMRQQQRDYLDNNKPLPRDFQQVVFDQVKPQIDRINNEFVKLSEVKSVPKGTIPFFNPNGDIEFVPKEHAQWASENGGRRIW